MRRPGYILQQAREHNLSRSSIYWRIQNKHESVDEAIAHLIKQRSNPSIASRCRAAGVNASTVRDRRRRKGMTVDEAIASAQHAINPVTLETPGGYTHHFRSLTAACVFADLPRATVVYHLQRGKTLQETVEFLYKKRGEEWH